ncbi:hypothetical protein psyc5s11_52980 [Clostridium gelidum]|uniref:ABC transporter permease n=1 Tax=Clostridium gelidum TaxID=704125 RepID=A0ABM7TMA4_9CLOT|nr:ABC transporter permease [Clostridium gelidum]BCZ49231.1 hypothetical protein psyc5s11_52980 [Clostridium gelidum]
MLNIIYCELLKLKKSYIIYVVLIGGMFMSILMNLVILVSEERVRTFESYSSNTEHINLLLLYIILFSLIVGYVFSREFTDKTSSILYTYPISRIKIFIGKLITIDILISLVYLVEIISIYLGYYVLYHTLPEHTFIISHIKYNIYSLIFQFLLIPIPILITNIGKNIMLPVVYGVVGTIVTNVIGESDFLIAKHFPLAVPYNFIKKLYWPNLTDLNYSVISGMSCFIISMIICIYQYNKDDII